MTHDQHYRTTAFSKLVHRVQPGGLGTQRRILFFVSSRRTKCVHSGLVVDIAARPEMRERKVIEGARGRHRFTPRCDGDEGSVTLHGGQGRPAACGTRGGAESRVGGSACPCYKAGRASETRILSRSLLGGWGLRRTRTTGYISCHGDGTEISECGREWVCLNLPPTG